MAELRAVKSLFGDHAYKLNISSTKSMHGHLLGAAGAIESLACIHAICDSIVPPTINFSEEDPDIDYSLNLTLNEPQKRTVNVAVNNTFGFGGHNSCLIFTGSVFDFQIYRKLYLRSSCFFDWDAGGKFCIYISVF